MKTIHLLFLASLFVSIHPLQAQRQTVVLKGGTLLDFDGYGLSQNDISDAVVILQGGKIVQVGKQGKVKIPKGAQVSNRCKWEIFSTGLDRRLRYSQ